MTDTPLPPSTPPPPDPSQAQPAQGGHSQRSRAHRRRFYGYGYGMLKDIIRVPHLDYKEAVWILLGLVLSNIYMYISLGKFYLNMADYSHAILVPVIAAAAAWKIIAEAKKGDLPVAVGDWRGFPLLIVGLVIQFFAMWYEIGLVAGGVASEYFTSVGIVFTVWGIFICFFGVAAIRMFWFPLLYLLFLIPGLPGYPETWLKNILRNIVTASSSWILSVFGFSVYVSNNVIEIPDVQLGVADACSGIRSLWAMLAVAPAIAWFLRLRPFLIGLFVPLGVFLAIFQNVLRVVATALLCHWGGGMSGGGMVWAEGTRHDIVGGVSFFLSSIIMVLLSRFLAPPAQGKSDVYGSYGTYGVYGVYGAGNSYGGYSAYHASNDPEAKEGDAPHAMDAGTQRERFFTGIARVRIGVYFLLFLLFMAQLMIFQRYAIRSRVQYLIARNRQTLDAFPGEVGPYRRIHWGELPEDALRVLRPSESYVAYYVSPENKMLHVIINFWEPVIGFNGNSWAFPHSPDVCFRGAGWEIEDPVPLPDDLNDPHEIMFSRMYANDTKRQMVLYWYNRDQISILMNEQIEYRATHGNVDSYKNRIQHMLRSWKHPEEYSRFQYSIGVYAELQGSRDETVALAQDFARHLRTRTGAFGLTPLQKINLDDLEASIADKLSTVAPTGTPTVAPAEAPTEASAVAPKEASAEAPTGTPAPAP